MEILLTTNLPKIGFTEMEGKAEIIMPERHKFTPEELTERIVDADFLISTFDYKITEAMMEAGKQLKAIINFGVGFNNVDVAAATRRGLPVTNTQYPLSSQLPSMPSRLCWQCRTVLQSSTASCVCLTTTSSLAL